MNNNISMSLRTIRVSSYVFRIYKRVYYVLKLYKFCFKKVFEFFVIMYLNNILIYFQNEKKYTNHVQRVLKRLKKYKLFAKLNKCVFNLEKIDYLKFIIKLNNICINFARIAIIIKWIVSTTRWHVRAFLKFVEFYSKYIKKFSKIVKSLTNFLKKTKKEEFDKEFELTKQTRIAFE